MSWNDATMPFVSVIIPVYNDGDRLKVCLENLSKQSYPRDLYEIIVVDNGSDESIDEIINLYDCNIYCHVEETPGSYVARNKGIAHARGEILAFTDSDCIPKLDWIEKGVEGFRQTQRCGLLGGRIELFFQNPASPTAVEVYESIEMNFPQESILAQQRYAFTANAFTSKEVIDNVGCFNDALKSGGDREWGQRIFKAGYNQAYADDALVQHPARHSFWQLYKRVTRINGGNLDAEKVKSSERDKSSAIMKDLLLAFTPPFRSVLRIFFEEERLSTNTQKVQFIIAMLFVRYVSAWERIRLRLGGASRRW